MPAMACWFISVYLAWPLLFAAICLKASNSIARASGPNFFFSMKFCMFGVIVILPNFLWLSKAKW